MAWLTPLFGDYNLTIGTAISLTEPAGIQQGDLMVAMISHKNLAIPAPDGWTLVANQNGDPSTNQDIAVAGAFMAYCVRGASPPTLTFTSSSGSNVMGGIILAYRGAATNPFDTHVKLSTYGASPLTATSITTALDGELIVFAAYGARTGSFDAFDAATNPAIASSAIDMTTPPTDDTWIERFDESTSSASDMSIGIADAVRATAGATGDFSVAKSNAFGRSWIIAAAFKVESSVIAIMNGIGNTTAVGAPSAALDTAVMTGIDNTGSGGGVTYPDPILPLSGGYLKRIGDDKYIAL